MNYEKNWNLLAERSEKTGGQWSDMVHKYGALTGVGKSESTGIRDSEDM